MVAQRIEPRGRILWQLAALCVGSTVGWAAATFRGPVYDISMAIEVQNPRVLTDELTAHLKHPARLKPLIQELQLAMAVQQLAARLRVTATEDGISLSVRTWEVGKGQQLIKRLSAETRVRLEEVTQEQQRSLAEQQKQQEQQELYLRRVRELQQEASQSPPRWFQRKRFAIPPDPLFPEQLHERAVKMRQINEQLSEVTKRLEQLVAAPHSPIRIRRLSVWSAAFQRRLTAIMTGLLAVLALSWGFSFPEAALRHE